ncbi:hypothetical protein J7F03_34220 [Streptomyces sp. ISL-43]|uniref:hypothetical protein n=1 Tax=Streptomyces sp. ISL-43 TaxID=2819183 RepID=UPI001BE809A0|nr:hypothetical protein [Streptomyces sp. ISL-43]MBT2452028.1 hypothetical protein [Streptomyces sp. ISL-43]
MRYARFAACSQGERAIRVRRYKTELAVLVPADWYERAVAATGEPGIEPPAANS